MNEGAERKRLVMPYSIQGTGTALVNVSKTRKVNGQEQYDAIEAIVILAIPVIVLRVIHILGSGEKKPFSDAYNAIGMFHDTYQYFELKPSNRLRTKGILNGLGTVLLIFGGGAMIFFALISPFMDRPINYSDRTFHAFFVLLFLIGLVSKVVWYSMNVPDERIKDILGPHALGSSDPFDWPDELADLVILEFIDEADGLSLMEIARQELARGNRSKAMACVRLVMRDGNNFAAQALFDHLMKSSP